MQPPQPPQSPTSPFSPDSPQMRRHNRIASIKKSLQNNTILKKNSLNLQTRMQKITKRKQSIKKQDDSITDSQINLMIQKEQEDQHFVGLFQQRYEIGDTIGAGTNGLVRKCYLKSNNQLFAVKTIILDDEYIMFLKKNFKYIKSLKHPNIIQYHYIFLDRIKSVCHLVMDYDSSPNLLNFINKMQEQEIKNIMFQLISTIAYIHQYGICHRDIKPDNILYDQETKKIKIIDFGISKKIIQRQRKTEMLTITGTLYYRAPEMFLGGGYDEMVDLWAAGITLYQLIANGKTPFQSEYLSTTIQNIISGEFQFQSEIWNNYDKFARDLVSRLLKKYPERLNAQEAKKHLWFINQKHEKQQKIDLYKSDSFNIKNLVPLQRNVSYDYNNEDIKFERSLTNQKSPLEDNKDKQMRKTPGILAKWLAESDEEDVLVDVVSEDEEA